MDPVTPEQQAEEFLSFCSELPGFNKPDYSLIERGILSGDYLYDEVDHILTTHDGWRTRIEPDGRFVPIAES
jgi:hypothetical protein